MLTFITCHLLRCFYQKPVVTHANCILFVLTIMPSLMIICFYKIATCQHFNQRVQLSYKLPSIGINWVDFHSFSVCQGKARNLANTTGSDINFVLKMYYRCLLLPSPPPHPQLDFSYAAIKDLILARWVYHLTVKRPTEIIFLKVLILKHWYIVSYSKFRVFFFFSNLKLFILYWGIAN